MQLKQTNLKMQSEKHSIMAVRHDMIAFTLSWEISRFCMECFSHEWVRCPEYQVPSTVLTLGVHCLPALSVWSKQC